MPKHVRMSTIDALANALLAKIRQSPRKSLDSAAGAYTSSRRDVVVIDEYALDKSAAAAEARWHGEQAVDEAMGGAWDSAVHELEVACRIERGYGDDPAWRGPLAIARAEADAREWD